MAGGMDVVKNKFVEQWATNRENLELVFKFNRRTVPVCVLFGLVVPLLTYRGITSEFGVSIIGLLLVWTARCDRTLGHCRLPSLSH